MSNQNTENYCVHILDQKGFSIMKNSILSQTEKDL